LNPGLQQTIDEQIQEYADFLSHRETDDEDLSYEAGLLARRILAYESLRPGIANEIRTQVMKTGNASVQKILEEIIHNSNFLQAVYGNNGMITTFDGLVKFFESNSDNENLGVGLTTFGFTFIDFTRKLREPDEDALRAVARKYGVSEGLELSDQRMTFEMDTLVYAGGKQYDMKKLIPFLKEVNAVLGIKNFSTGLEFQLRKFREE
jgi:hypothetical protein